MLKRDLISIVLNLQSTEKVAEKNNRNNELVEEMCKFNDIFIKLQSDWAVTKQVNTERTKRIVTLERQCG